jgi:hypothetical protein
LFLNEKDCTSYLHDIEIQIYNKLVNMGLSTKESFHEFLLELQIDEHISYEQFSSNMKKLNHKQWIITNDIYIYIYIYIYI